MPPDVAVSGFSTLRAGVGEVDITPWAGVQLAGAGGYYRPGRYVLDPLYARALVLEREARKLCIVSLDLCLPTRRFTDPVRQTAAERFGLDPKAVLVHLTQSHTAPSLGHFMLSDDYPGIPPEMDWLRGGDLQYSAWAVERIVEAIRLAHEALQPVQLGVGSGSEGRLAHNRRAVTREGRVIMPGPTWPRPLGWTQIRYLEGPIDPEVGVIALRDRRLALAGLLVNYACHPVHVFPKPLVSADWPGALVQALRTRYGPTCRPLVLNGCCGNINPWDPFDPNYVPDHQRMGRMLAETTERVLETLEFQEDAVLDWRARHLALPLRAPEPERLEQARERVAQQHTPPPDPHRAGYIDNEWLLASSLLDMEATRQRAPLYDYEIQVLRLGDIAIVGLPGEPFVEGQLRLKLESRARYTYVAHDTTSYVGYLPIPQAFARGGHEVTTGNWSRLVPEALDMVVNAAVEMIAEMLG